MGTKVRILVALSIGGVMFKPDQVVDLPAALAKQHAAAGEVDTHKEAVAYCINELGSEVIVYEAPPSPEEAQLQSEIATLEASLAEAPEGTSASIQQALDEKKAALAALQ